MDKNNKKEFWIVANANGMDWGGERKRPENDLITVDSY